MNGWILAKYALALSGLALVLAGDSPGRPWVGYAGLALLVAAFALRFLQRRFDQSRTESAPPN